MKKNVAIIHSGILNGVDYPYAMQNRIPVFCNAIFEGEGAIKYLLSSEPVDEILVLIHEADQQRLERNESVIKSHMGGFASEDQDLNFWEMFKSRILAFMQEQHAILDKYDLLIAGDKRAAVKKACDAQLEILKNAEGIPPQKAFSYLAASSERFNEYISEVAEEAGLRLANERWLPNYIRAYLYDGLSDKYKMFMLPENSEVRLTPLVLWRSNGETDQAAVTRLSEFLLSEEVACHIYDYGGNPAQSYVVNSIYALVDALSDKMEIVGRYSTAKNEQAIFGEIKNDLKAYDIITLLNGMSEFVQYAKVDKIMEYIYREPERNELVDHLLYAMRDVDAGITICDVDALVDGLIKIRDVFKKDDAGNTRLKYMKEIIRQGYGELLKGDELDTFALVRWAYQKKFYQQCLTIIEALIPEDMAKRGIYYYCDDPADLEKVTLQFAKEYNALASYEHWKMNIVEHYFTKTYGRGMADRKGKSKKEKDFSFAEFKTALLANTDENIMTAYSKCTSEEILCNVLFAYFYAGTVRNTTNHAESEDNGDLDLFRDESMEIDKMRTVKDCIEVFIQTYETACLDVAEIPYTQIRISNAEVKKAAKELKNKG